MTVEQKFARWIKFSILVFVMVFTYFLFADYKIPLTPQAMVSRGVTQVVPRVNGNVVAIHIANNQLVKQGDLLFTIDPKPYQLAVEKAELALELAQQTNHQLDASLAAAKADVVSLGIVAQQKRKYAQRLAELFIKHSISQQQKDDAQSESVAEQANLQAAQARLNALRFSRGEMNDNNVNIRLARNQLRQAKLNLSYTQVRAERGGIVANLQLAAGAYATVGQPLLALVSTEAEVIADFREKSSRLAVTGSKALITFDGDPGQLYSASVIGMDAGVSVGQFDANGRLATPSTSTRWVRDAQRMRIHFSLEGAQTAGLPSGAQATVQLLPEDGLFRWLAKTQISLLSMLHYIY
ncbi:HlyD family secretion protein [Agarivorans sp. QJM3NY_25]|uniref:HlyD family secretion protein n=1 Tax=Agarivorans sp. QJM3NY_25 TaxID=3421430 RepID=UPI003D7C3E06